MITRLAFHHVSKRFSYTPSRKLLRTHAQNWFRPAKSNVFYALRDVSFSVRDGEGLAVIGPNGAGKSTLLGVATQLCYPEEGSVSVNGRVAALLELGSGFHSDLTGEENLRINASLLGMSRKTTNDLFEAIVDFSGLGDFIQQPLRIYSTGMVLRLAFSVAIHADPDILVIDEVIAVGDSAFQAKCFERLLQFRRAGKTILCATHSAALLLEICDKAIWLDHGHLVAEGSLQEILAAYEPGVPIAPRDS